MFSGGDLRRALSFLLTIWWETAHTVLLSAFRNIESSVPGNKERHFQAHFKYILF